MQYWSGCSSESHVQGPNLVSKWCTPSTGDSAHTVHAPKGECLLLGLTQPKWSKRLPKSAGLLALILREMLAIDSQLALSHLLDVVVYAVEDGALIDDEHLDEELADRKRESVDEVGGGTGLGWVGLGWVGWSGGRVGRSGVGTALGLGRFSGVGRA